MTVSLRCSGLRPGCPVVQMPQRLLPQTKATGHGRLRLRYHRRRFGRLRAGQQAQRRRAFFRPGARGRTARPGSADPCPGRRLLGAPRSPDQLELHDGGGTRTRRPPGLDAARQGGRWLLVDQLHGLHARPSLGLRQLGPPAGAGGLGFGGLPALLQGGRDQRSRRQRLARRFGPARRHQGRLRGSPVRCLPGGRAAGRPGLFRRSQRLPARGCGALRCDQAGRQALQRGGRPPAPGAGAPQPHAAHRRHGPPHRRCRQPGDGRGVREGRQGPPGRGRTRDHPVGRGDQLAPGADALGHRTGRPPARTRHRRRARPARRRTQPDGSRHRGDAVCLHQVPADASRRPSAQQDDGRRPLAARPPPPMSGKPAA